VRGHRVDLLDHERELISKDHAVAALHVVATPYAVDGSYTTLLDATVFSAFRARGNGRFDVERCVPGRAGRRWALAHRMIVDGEWARTVADRAYDVNVVAAIHETNDRLAAVASQLPVEFDTLLEYRRSRNLLEANMSGTRGPACRPEPSRAGRQAGERGHRAHRGAGNGWQRRPCPSRGIADHRRALISRW
jgi:hypothetical protein